MDAGFAFGSCELFDSDGNSLMFVKSAQPAFGKTFVFDNNIGSFRNDQGLESTPSAL